MLPWGASWGFGWWPGQQGTTGAAYGFGSSLYSTLESPGKVSAPPLE